MPATLPMRNTRSRTLFAWCLLASAWLGIRGAQAQTSPGDYTYTDRFWSFQPLASDDWRQHFRLGVLAGLNISANFSMNGNFGVSGSGIPGVYADGYVRTDNTGSAGGFTSFWGYNDASQISGTTLTLHQAAGFTTSATSTEQNPYSLGLDVAYGHSYWYWAGMRIGWEFGFGWLPIGITNDHTLPASVNTEADTYNLGNIVVPTPPYQGGPSGLGPTITNNFFGPFHQ